MRFAGLVILVSTALMLSSVPARAQWRDYVSNDFGFAFHAPCALSAERGSYKADTSGEYPTVVYACTDDNIVYRASVADCRERASEGASLLEEAAYTFTLDKNVLLDDYGRVDTVYGRKVTVDLPDGAGRAAASFYFDRGYLFQLTATVLPANGDYGSPNLSRFLDSHTFAANRVEPDATVLGLPN
jgi:hypothetical protein